jgi:hypothetical protein
LKNKSYKSAESWASEQTKRDLEFRAIADLRDSGVTIPTHLSDAAQQAEILDNLYKQRQDAMVNYVTTLPKKAVEDGVINAEKLAGIIKKAVIIQELMVIIALIQAVFNVILTLVVNTYNSIMTGEFL